MADKLTPQQQRAVDDRGGKLLISAAAGSGKTKVLVDRLMGYLSDPVTPANIDDFLIITYTTAAAAELRAKIAAKLSEKIAMDPTNRHMQRQMQRLYLAKISTIHSFCSDILREHAYRLDIPSDFRMAEGTEIADLQMSAMNQVLEDAYVSLSPDFLSFVDNLGSGRDDRNVPEIILEVYEKSRCHVDPNGWLEQCLRGAGTEGVTDVSQTVWGSFLLEDLKNELSLHIEALEVCIKRATLMEHMEKPLILLKDTVYQLKHLRDSQTWDEVVERKEILYGTLRFDKKCLDEELISQIKAVRDACKEGVSKKLKNFSDYSDVMLDDLHSTASATKGLLETVKAFATTYAEKKYRRHVVDFSDLEQKTLDLLVGKNRSAPTNLACELGSRYREVMVDEYQDSNSVQDRIFSALTQKRQNCFMVGDVKQSIYQFRLADPGIFLEKYNSYVSAEQAQLGEGRKVLLISNFRSSGGVIQGVNDVFSQCMSSQVGGLEYTQDEALKEGLPHVRLSEPEVELYGIEVAEDTYREEATFTVNRICQLLDGTHMVRQDNRLRPIVPDDIVILLRSPNSVAGEFCQALEKKGIRYVSGNSTDLFQTEEICTLISVLQTIHNPFQDIPLTATMMSRVFAFTADELTTIRAESRYCCMYDAVKKSKQEKTIEFVSLLSQLRNTARVSTLVELVNAVLSQTRLDSIFAAMSDGQIRVENIHTFCQMAASFADNGQGDLGHFLNYLDNLRQQGLATGEENVTGAVRIMSIHKSKGLEFPVVFLCGLSKTFNTEDVKAPVLCDRELGLGLCCVDMENRVRFPTVAKKAIAVKMRKDSVSEELRVLYVAMTRARDRLIMTYAQRNLSKKLTEFGCRLDMTPRELITSDVSCSGDWVLQSALCRAEATAFFDISVHPELVKVREEPWKIAVVEANTGYIPVVSDSDVFVQKVSQSTVDQMAMYLDYQYPYTQATQVPSKQTATQLKGRMKDQEVAEETPKSIPKHFRKPSFTTAMDGKAYGTAVHSVMQHIDFSNCGDIDAVKSELKRMVDDQYISQEIADMVDPEKIADFFETEIGKRMLLAKEVLREFKFSILDDAVRYGENLEDERILLQGVVDCALIDDDGLTILDFKTDVVTEDTLGTIADKYRNQVQIYAYAMERIYQKPVKEALLYFFRLRRFVRIA